ncbi:MAG: hypothetical protein ACC700_17580 [Anaerolineales bacterium]
MNSTSELIENRRDRLQRLLQNATGDFELRFDFGETDRISPGHLILGMEPDLIPIAPHRQLIGRVLHLLGHYLNETTEWWPVVRREEDFGRPHFVPLWHALEDARFENLMVERWPGADKFLKAKIPPNIGGSLIKLMSTTQQIEMGLYIEGRGVRNAVWDPAVRETLEHVSESIRAGARGPTPRASLEAMIESYPAVAHLIRAEHVPKARHQSLQTDRDLLVMDRSEGRAADSPERETTDELVSVGLTGRKRELPEWFRPGSAPWFERGLGGKEVHPLAVRLDQETIIAPPDGDPDRYHALLAEVKHEAGLLLRKLTALLREDAYLRYGGHYRSGSLNTTKLWKQRLGVYRLFQRRIGGRDRQVAFTLMVDESASMKGQDKYEMATKTAILLGETLSQLDVPLEIIGFSTAEYEAQAAMKIGLLPAHEHRTTRCSALQHRIYKRFDEPFPITRARLAGIRPRNNNWDEEHLLFAFRRIRTRPEKRKVIIVISDGQPNGDAEYLIRTVETLERMDCKVIGVGIGADFVKHIYPNAVVVSSFRQTALELLGLLMREFGVRPPRSAPAPELIGNYGALS